ncbi:MAG: hypothetical protein QXM68_03100 [Candidatus Aenigmatarchaeota archaeon]|nr:hypothetical protein [Candidatus Aenigmarchaeota archaeon]
MRIFVVLLILFAFFIIINLTRSQEISLYCYVTNFCEYTDVFHISDLTDAHAEINSENNYEYKVCCNLNNGFDLNVVQRSYGGIIGFSYTTNAHAEIGNKSNYEYMIDMIPEHGDVFCTSAYSCDDYNTCLVSISGETDAHLGDCVTNPYQLKICCSYGSLDINISSNVTRLEYGNDFKIYGHATKAGIPLENSHVNINVNNFDFCAAMTNSNGYYECSFKSPKRIGKINITATITDESSLKTKSAYTQIDTYISYGSKIERTDTVCIEKPALIQNEDGSIDIVTVNLCLWK